VTRQRVASGIAPVMTWVVFPACWLVLILWLPMHLPNGTCSRALVHESYIFAVLAPLQLLLQSTQRF